MGPQCYLAFIIFSPSPFTLCSPGGQAHTFTLSPLSQLITLLPSSPRCLRIRKTSPDFTSTHLPAVAPRFSASFLVHPQRCSYCSFSKPHYLLYSLLSNMPGITPALWTLCWLPVPRTFYSRYPHGLLPHHSPFCSTITLSKRPTLSTLHKIASHSHLPISPNSAFVTLTLHCYSLSTYFNIYVHGFLFASPSPCPC